MFNLSPLSVKFNVGRRVETKRKKKKKDYKLERKLAFAIIVAPDNES